MLRPVLPWGFVGKMITQKNCALSLITNMLAIPLTILEEQSAKRENRPLFQYVTIFILQRAMTTCNVSVYREVLHGNCLVHMSLNSSSNLNESLFCYTA